MRLEANGQDMPGWLPERETATDLGLVRQFDLKNVREHDLFQTRKIGLVGLGPSLFHQLLRDFFGFTQQIRHGTLCFSRIHILTPFPPRSNAIFLHHPFYSILSHMQELPKFAMTHGIVFFIPSFDSIRHFFIFLCLFSLNIERPTGETQRLCHVLFGIGAVGMAELVRQLHLLYRC